MNSLAIAQTNDHAIDVIPDMKPANTTRDLRRRYLDEDICVHIFTASAAMVDVCLTVIGIIRVVISLRKSNLAADDLLAANAMLYLTSMQAPIAAVAGGRGDRAPDLPGGLAQRRVASTPSSASSALKPAFSRRLATSRGTSRPLVSLFGLPV
jgi:hypothetical protein